MGLQQVNEIKEYLKNNVKQGYDIYYLANYLVSQGYDVNDVNLAVKEAQQEKNSGSHAVISEKKLAIVGGAIVFLLLLVIGFIFGKSLFFGSSDSLDKGIQQEAGNMNSLSETSLPQQEQSAKTPFCGYCEHMVDNKCERYECCKASECEADESCENHLCVAKENSSNETPEVPPQGLEINFTNKTCTTPVDCSDDNGCTVDFCRRQYNETLYCAYKSINSGCGPEDGCCPSGCSVLDDFDCFDKCQDGTINGDCSSEKPKKCVDKKLVDDCETCGCGQGYFCTQNKSCVKLEDLYSNISNCAFNTCQKPNNQTCRCGDEISDSRNPYCCAFESGGEVFKNFSLNACFFCEDPSNPRTGYRSLNQTCIEDYHCNTTNISASVFCKLINSYNHFESICCKENECASKTGCVKAGTNETYIDVNTNEEIKVSCQQSGVWWKV